MVGVGVGVECGGEAEEGAYSKQTRLMMKERQRERGLYFKVGFKGVLKVFCQQRERGLYFSQIECFLVTNKNSGRTRVFLHASVFTKEEEEEASVVISRAFSFFLLTNTS